MQAPQPVQASASSVTRPLRSRFMARYTQRLAQLMQTTPFQDRQLPRSRCTRPSFGRRGARLSPCGQAAAQAPHQVQPPRSKVR
jgi:hypothetical protein